MKLLYSNVIVVVWLALNAPALGAELVPVEAFSQLSQLSHPKVSPDGLHLAYVQRKDGDDVLVVAQITEDHGLVEVGGFTSGEHITFNWVAWANNNRLLTSLTTQSRIRGIRKHRFPFRRLLAINKDTSDAKVLLEDKRFSWFRFRNDDVIDMLDDDPDHVLVGFSQKGDYQSSVYKLNINTGEKELILKPEEGQRIYNWYADSTGRLRYGYGRDKKWRPIMLIRRENDEWFPLHKNELFEDGRFRPLGFGDDEHHILVLSSHVTGRDSVFRFDLEAGELAGKVFEHEEVDIDGLIVSKTTDKVVAIRYTLDWPQKHYLDKDYEHFRTTLDKALPGRVNKVVSVTKDERFAVVWSGNDRDPGIYFLYDGTTTPKRLLMFGRPYPKIDPEKMVPMKRVTYEARDSLKIPAYLTMPQDTRDIPRPAVVMPHGGPWTRDSRLFDMWSQFLANRGYVVLQPNFRGSSGYGDRFEALGYGAWGRAMQDDLTDGAKWMIAEGLADPDRICIVGASYGGYAALMGVIKTPEIFKCAAAFAPVTNVKLFLREDGDYDTRDYDYRRVAGNLTKKELDRISPIKRIKDINAPILLVHGEDDARVSVKHSQTLEQKMRKAKKDVRYVEIAEETHYLEKESSRLTWLTELEIFLAKHIGTDPSPETEVAVEAASDAE